MSIMALSSNHLPPKPIRGGRPDIEMTATSTVAKVIGMVRASPPVSAKLRVPVRRMIPATARKRIPFTIMWFATR